jgi:hypothetical protein
MVTPSPRPGDPPPELRHPPGPLAALHVDEIDEVCAAASTIEGDSADDRLLAFLNRVPGTPRASATSPQISCPTDKSDSVVVASRDRVLASGAPLRSADQETGQMSAATGLAQILDLVVAIATMPGRSSKTSESWTAAPAAKRVLPARPPAW